MSTTLNLPYNFQWSDTHAHIAWADLHNNGVLVEIAVIALDQKNGDLHFIKIAGLDNVDKERLVKIIQKRDAANYPLWDLMSMSTLKNGMNALEYFNQLIKVRSVSGQIFTPNAGKMGAGVRHMTPRPNVNAQSAQPQPQAQAETQVQSYQQTVADTAVAQTSEQAVASTGPRKGPGKPPRA